MYCCFTDIDATKRHPRRTILREVQLLNWLAAETELAETTREPTGADGRSVDWTLPNADPGASARTDSPAHRTGETAIL